MHLDMFRLQLSTSGKGHESAGKEMTKAAINISYRCAPPGYSSQPSTPRPITCPAPCLHPPLVRFPHTDVPCSALFHRSSRRPPSMAIAFIRGQTTARSERTQIKKHSNQTDLTKLPQPYSAPGPPRSIWGKKSKHNIFACCPTMTTVLFVKTKACFLA